MERPLSRSIELPKLSPRAALLTFLGLTFFAVAVVLTLPPIPENHAYHNFADTRPLLGFPNSFDVMSNWPYLVIGSWGVAFLYSQQGAARFIDRRERWAYVAFFIGVFFTGIGSSYYHWAPTNETLVWDRLPVTVGFMGIFSAMIAERINLRLGLRLLPFLLLFGLFSVVYWNWTEQQGAGDLRAYGLVQYYSLVAMILMLVFCKPCYTRGRAIGIGLGLYVLAKLVESLDKQIYALGGIVSGHTIKHLLAAAAVAYILWMLKKRQAISLE